MSDKTNSTENHTTKTDEISKTAVSDSPRMTEDEMKKFVSVIGNTEALEGDYVFNGFIFFFQTLAETIKENPVEAQNILFHLQLHVFNKMWESHYAFDAHRKKAASIFEKSEPYVDFGEVETYLDFSESSTEGLANVLSGILKNPNLPENIHNAIAEVLDVPESDPHTPETVLWNLQKTEAKDEKQKHED